MYDAPAAELANASEWIVIVCSPAPAPWAATAAHTCPLPQRAPDHQSPAPQPGPPCKQANRWTAAQMALVQLVETSGAWADRSGPHLCTRRSCFSPYAAHHSRHRQLSSRPSLCRDPMPAAQQRSALEQSMAGRRRTMAGRPSGAQRSTAATDLPAEPAAALGTGCAWRQCGRAPRRR